MNIVGIYNGGNMSLHIPTVYVWGILVRLWYTMVNLIWGTLMDRNTQIFNYQLGHHHFPSSNGHDLMSTSHFQIYPKIISSWLYQTMSNYIKLYQIMYPCVVLFPSYPTYPLNIPITSHYIRKQIPWKSPLYSTFLVGV